MMRKEIRESDDDDDYDYDDDDDGDEDEDDVDDDDDDDEDENDDDDGGDDDDDYEYDWCLMLDADADAAADDDDGDDDADDDRDCKVVLSDANCAVLSDPTPVVPSDPATMENRKIMTWAKSTAPQRNRPNKSLQLPDHYSHLRSSAVTAVLSVLVGVSFQLWAGSARAGCPQVSNATRPSRGPKNMNSKSALRLQPGVTPVAQHGP